MQSSTMSVKNAAFLAFVGTLLLSVLLALDFINAVVAYVRNLVPVIPVLRSAIYVFAGVCLTMFLFTFSRRER